MICTALIGLAAKAFLSNQKELSHQCLISGVENG